VKSHNLSHSSVELEEPVPKPSGTQQVPNDETGLFFTKRKVPQLLSIARVHVNPVPRPKVTQQLPVAKYIPLDPQTTVLMNPARKLQMPESSLFQTKNIHATIQGKGRFDSLDFGVSQDLTGSLAQVGFQNILFISATYFNDCKLKCLGFARVLPTSDDAGFMLKNTFIPVSPGPKAKVSTDEYREVDGQLYFYIQSCLEDESPSRKCICSTEDEAFARLMEDLDECHCVMFTSTIDCAKFLGYVKNSRTAANYEDFTNKVLYLTNLKWLVKSSPLTPELFYSSPLLVHIFNPVRSPHIHRTALFLLKCCSALVKAFHFNFVDVFQDSENLWKLAPTVIQQDPVSNVSMILSGEVKLETSPTYRINFLPYGLVVLDAVFYKTINQKGEGGEESFLMNLGLCFECNSEVSKVNTMFIPIQPSSQKAGKQLGYKYHDNKYFYEGVLCYTVDVAIQEQTKKKETKVKS